MTTNGNGVALLLENKNAVIYGAGGPTAAESPRLSPGTHFVSLQRASTTSTPPAVMNAADARTHHPGIGARHDNGINPLTEVISRATFAVPARAQRAYPHHQERTHT